MRTTIAAEARSKGDKPRLEWVTIFLKNPKNVGQSRIPISPFPEGMGLSPKLLKNRPSGRDALVPRPLAAPLSESYTPFDVPVAIAHQRLSQLLRNIRQRRTNPRKRSNLKSHLSNTTTTRTSF